MLLKLFVLVYWAVLRHTISSQPVNENNLISNSPETIYKECCPCSNLLEVESNSSDEEISPTYKITSFPRLPTGDCPCRSTEADSLGSSSIFRPFLLRTAQPVERQGDSKQDVKPLLQPEVGLASSVLETLQKATDEEYEDALARDAARSAAKIGHDFFDSATGSSRNSMTIMLNPGEDLYDDDTIPETSHVQETRCVHEPLRREYMVGRARIMNPSSKEYLLKRRPLSLFHKSYDMDNSASNAIERLHENCNNNLGNKLKMNPLLLNMLPDNNEGQFQGNSNPTSESGYQLQKVSPKYYTDLDKNNNDRLIKSPAIRLAELRNKLRDLSEMRNFNLLNNNLKSAKSNQLYNFNYQQGNPDAESNNEEANIKSPVDTFFDKQSPIVKTILKLKDVELITPVKTTDKGLMKENNADLKFAGTENNDSVLVTLDNNIDEIDIDTVKNDTITDHKYLNKLFNGSLKQVNSKEDEKIKNSCEIQSPQQIITELEDSSASKEMVQSQADESTLSQITDSSIKGKINLKFLEDSFENKSKVDDDNVEDATPIIINGISQKSSKMEDNMLNDNNFENSNIDEEVCYRQNIIKSKLDQSNLQRNMLGKNVMNNNLLQYNNDNLLSFKEDMLRRLENLKMTIKSKIQEPQHNLSVFPKNISENNESTQIGTSTLEEKTDVSIDDLQKYFGNQLEKEKSFPSESVSSQEADCCTVNNFKSTSEDCGKPTEIHYIETQLDENTSPGTNYDIGNNDDSKLKSLKKDNYLQGSDSVCDTITDDRFDTNTVNDLSKDFLPINEMSSEASTFRFNAVRPTMDNNNLESALQDIIVQPSQLTDIISPVHNNLLMPSLEDIRKGITDIINAGEKEDEEFKSAISDSLNESSNYNPFASANTHVRSDILKLRPLKHTHDTLSGIRHNVYPYKSDLSVAKTTPLKVISMKSLLNDKAGTHENVLSKQEKDLLGKTKPEFQRFLETMNKRREDLNEKVEALHVDLNDRLASIHDKLLDQTNLQAINIPKTNRNNKSLNLLGLDRETQTQNSLLGKLNNIESYLPSTSRSLKLQDKTKNSEIIPLSVPNMNKNNGKHNLRKQSNFKPLRSSNVKIMFSTTTMRPVMNPKLIKKPVLNLPATKLLKDKNNNYNAGFIRKDVSKPYYSKNKSFSDTSNAPSELIQAKIPLTKDFSNEIDEETNSNMNFDGHNLMIKSLNQNQPVFYNDRHATKLLESSQISDLPNTKESSIISNMRDTLRARLKNTPKAPKNVKTQETTITGGFNSDRRILSPENVKTNLVDSALKENTSYKCSMICVKDP